MAVNTSQKKISEYRFLMGMDESVVLKGLSFWMDKDGKLYSAKYGHVIFSQNYLSSKGIEFSDDNDFQQMYRLGFLRVHVDRSNGTLYFDYDLLAGQHPTKAQLQELRNLAIENKLELNDDTLHEPVDLYEGLSFSDQYDDSIPYEAKPPQMLTPMEEDDAKGNKISGAGWMDRHGIYHSAGSSHIDWAINYLKVKKPEYSTLGVENEEIYDEMYKLGFVRVVVYPLIESVYFQYRISINLPTNHQIRVLKNFARYKHYELYDEALRKLVELEESVINEGKDILINGMNPEQKEEFKSCLAKLFSHLKNELKLKTTPQLSLLEDKTNAKKVLGRTGYYDPKNKKICLYMTERHPKDILRSFAHEVIHHWQHENRQLDKSEKKGESDPQYAQHDPWMRQMEKQAYLLGNMLFRDWEDEKKSQDRKSGKKLAERTYSIGNEYPPKKTDYRG